MLTDQFILLSPCGFLAQDYVLVPRLAAYLGYEKHLYKAHLVVKFFVWSDVVTFMLQAGGGGMSAIVSLANTGKYVRPIESQPNVDPSISPFLFIARSGWPDYPVDQLLVLLRHHPSMGLLGVR
jgi:hypothetical protein